MSFENDFDEIFGNLTFFNSRLMKRFSREIDEIFEQAKSEKLRGTWETREIKEPGVNGFIIMGRFGTDKALEPFEPLKPQKRRPLPDNPFDISKNVIKEGREPLTDTFEEENATKVYVELPGEEDKDIHLDFATNSIEVKAKSFYKKINLPCSDVSKETVTTKYKNGVLEITIPRKKPLRKEDAKRERLV